MEDNLTRRNRGSVSMQVAGQQRGSAPRAVGWAALADIEQSARRMASDFFAFARLNEALTDPAEASTTGPATGPEAEHHAVAEPAAPGPARGNPAFWLAVTLALTTLVLYLMPLM